MFFRKLETFLIKLYIFIISFFIPAPKISILIPFRTDNPERKKVFRWVLKYWKHQIPDAEIIIGKSRSKVFCKTEALNRAAVRSRGQVLVILDADAYMYGSIVEKCANKILEDSNDRLWFIPYRKLYRLNKKITDQIIQSDPRNPLRLPSPPPKKYLDDNGDKAGYGHRYGAMIMIFPREALKILGGFDERFKGWGGEDVALLRALDTLYGKHKTTNNDILHLWHPKLGKTYKTRIWKGQKSSNANNNLAMAYHKATGHPSQMRKIVDDAVRYRKQRFS
jgi:predicted glycosyltransferase involved in capsule biosynthesis